MKGAPGTTVYTADPVARTVVADPSTTVAMTLTLDYLKASDNKIYAPFTVTVQPDVLGKGANLGAYIRLAPKGSAPPAAPAPLDPKAQKEKEKQDKKKKGKEAQDLAGQAVSGVEYPWEDYYDLTAVPRGPGGPLTFSRPFSVAAGEYDAYVAVAVKDPAAAPGPVKIAVHKATITVPNYWSNDFQISTVFLANKVTPLTEVPAGEAQKLKPYVIGNLEVSPAVDGKFASHGRTVGVLHHLRRGAGRRQEARCHHRLAAVQEGPARRGEIPWRCAPEAEQRDPAPGLRRGPGPPARGEPERPDLGLRAGGLPLGHQSDRQ